MRIILLSTILCTLLAACGSKGALYLPEKQYPQPEQTSK